MYVEGGRGVSKTRNPYSLSRGIKIQTGGQKARYFLCRFIPHPVFVPPTRYTRNELQADYDSLRLVDGKIKITPCCINSRILTSYKKTKVTFERIFLSFFLPGAHEIPGSDFVSGTPLRKFAISSSTRGRRSEFERVLAVALSAHKNKNIIT